MKLIVILLFCTALCTGLYYPEYEEFIPEYEETSIDDDSGAKFWLETCFKKGFKSSTCDFSVFSSFVPMKHKNVCKNAFKLGCADALESVQCGAGLEAAKIYQECDSQQSDVFKKCCRACKIGRNIKRETGKCADNFDALRDISKTVAMKCCHVEDYSDYEVSYDYKTTPIGVRSGEDNLIAEAIIAIRCSDFNPCHDNQVCVDSLTGLKCECKTGYEKNGYGNCQDINECNSGQHNCTQLNRRCENLEGSFKCSKCIEGFKSQTSFYSDEGDDTCIDIDECEKSSCSSSEACTNLIGSYRCSSTKCPMKYKKSGENKCVWKNCDLQKSRFCHKTYSFVLKTVAASDTTNEILKFYATTYTGTFDKNLFEVIEDMKTFTLMQKKPLQQDERFQLIIKKGRKEHIKDVSVFKSDF